MSREERPPRADIASDNTDYMRWCACAECGSREHALWRIVLAECWGAALLVLLSCLPGCGPAAAASPLHRALASGFVVALLVQCLDHVSGAHLNPTVTLAALLWGKLSRTRALAMVCAQLVGACAGGAALHLLQPGPAADLCVTLPAQGLAAYKAALLEAVLGGCLALANCAAWDSRTAGLCDSWPLRIGVAVAGLSLVAGELTGASMNPVRSFGPALWSRNWSSHWVYWVGPLGGSLLCTSAYMAAWRPRAHAPRAASDVTPAPRKPRAEP